VKLKNYTEEEYSQWDAFVRNSANGTFMQERNFLNYHPAGRFNDCSLLVYDSHDKLLAVIPAAQQRAGEKTVFSSYPGASHGGIVIHRKFKTNNAMTLIPLLIKHCQDNGFKQIEIKLVPRIYHCRNCDELDFALRYYGFYASSTELATALHLLDDTRSAAGENAQRNIRKAAKLGVYIKESQEFKEYWDILSNNLQARHQAHPTHTLEEIYVLKDRYPQGIKLFAAYYEEKIIGGVLIFLLNNRVINCFYIAHDEKYQQLRPLNLLFYELINWGRKKGYHYLDWGISTENKGKYVNKGLFRFKEGFGGRGVLRETYRYDLN
jgi:hypothetical protein